MHKNRKHKSSKRAGGILRKNKQKGSKHAVSYCISDLSAIPCLIRINIDILYSYPNSVALIAVQYETFSMRADL